MIDQTLTDLLIRHEGYRKNVYIDTVGKYTIGIGKNLSDNGITKEEAIYLLENDINRWVLPTLNKIFPAFDKLSKPRQHALISMLYNLGESRFKGFAKMIDAVKAEKWPLNGRVKLATEL